VGALRLTDGIIGIGFKSNMVTVKSQTELGAIDANCGVCYWKKFAFSAQQSWVNGDSIILHAGKDILKIAYNTAAVFISQSLQSEEIKQFGCKVMSGKLILNAIRPDMKNILVYNISGRLLASASSPVQSIIELPRSISENVLCVVVIYKNGAVIRRVLPILH
jgi:hypothetical protein